LGVAMALGVLGVAGVSISLWLRTGAVTARGAAASRTSASPLVSGNDRSRAFLAQIRGYGGNESPELNWLVDEQSRPRLSAVRAAELPSRPIHAKRRASTNSPQQPRWRSALQLPEIPVYDDIRVRRVFEYFAENQEGRERFQAMIFRCRKYR